MRNTTNQAEKAPTIAAVLAEFERLIEGKAHLLGADHVQFQNVFNDAGSWPELDPGRYLLLEVRLALPAGPLPEGARSPLSALHSGSTTSYSYALEPRADSEAVAAEATQAPPAPAADSDASA